MAKVKEENDKKSVWVEVRGKTYRLLDLEKMPIKSFVDVSGEFQQAASRARKDYDSVRVIMTDRLEKTVGFDKPVYGKAFSAVLSHDEATEIDVLQFLEEVQSAPLRKLCIKILLGKAKEVLPAATYDMLAKKIRQDDPTLHVDKIKEE